MALEYLYVELEIIEVSDPIVHCFLSHNRITFCTTTTIVYCNKMPLAPFIAPLAKHNSTSCGVVMTGVQIFKF